MTRGERNQRFLPWVFFFSGSVTVGMGVAWRWLGDGGMYDPWWMRGSIAVACLVLAVLPWRRLIRPVRDVILMGVTIVVSLWVGVLLWGNGFPTTHSAGILVVEVACIASFRTVQGATAYVTAFVIMVLVAGYWTESPAVDPRMLALTSLAVGMLVVAAAAQRINLTNALRRSRDALEQQVKARTADLEAEVEERKRAERAALEASSAKSRFVANMSHELRTPLNAILGYAELAVEEVRDGAPVEEIERDLRAVRHSAVRLLALVNDILDLARVEAGKLDVRIEPVAVGPAVHRATSEIRPLAAKRGNTLLAEVGDVPAVDADPSRVHQILVNLLSNAAKFTDKGIVLVRAKSRNGRVAIEVQDSGIGIPASALPTLFDRFTQVDDSTTRTQPGTGLGLALSRDLARKMGGDLKVHSELGRGSTFTLWLPTFDET